MGFSGDAATASAAVREARETGSGGKPEGRDLSQAMFSTYEKFF